MNLKTNVKKEKSYDVIVVGSGPAGIGAAIAAARGGAKTLLEEAGVASLMGVREAAFPHTPRWRGRRCDIPLSYKEIRFFRHRARRQN